VFAGDRANQADFLTPYLSAALGCIGLNTVHYLPLQATLVIDEKCATEIRTRSSRRSSRRRSASERFESR
jgi:FMN-dependent NADH-azoreductase